MAKNEEALSLLETFPDVTSTQAKKVRHALVPYMVVDPNEPHKGYCTYCEGFVFLSADEEYKHRDVCECPDCGSETVYIKNHYKFNGCVREQRKNAVLLQGSNNGNLYARCYVAELFFIQYCYAPVITLTETQRYVFTEHKKLINNAQFDILSHVINKVAEAAALWIDNQLINGTADKIEGLKGITQTVTTDSAVAIKADELIDLQDSIPDAYQGGAIWFMSRKTRSAIRKLKDGEGNFLLNKDATSRWNYTLFGKPVCISDAVSDIKAGKPAVYYGDFSGLAVKTTETVNIEVLREKYATQHAIGVVAWLEMDAKVENAQKLAVLKMKA